ncbi:MAG TPA: undecaprenyl/decaprenyl-phosphate alpha-N-acetylglucosaminyl 1-phosphate transferase, partial [Phycisphaerales bacterium]|nr:undecaprenyl/decaprenyl-phosphate alpha-N-acetylglucosaminyl 1-phosphate transferase [Phycisphaerales bacterium]
MNTYVLVYLCSWLLALLVTPIVIRLARRFKMVDSSDIRKVHSRPVPRIGGVAVFVPMMVLTISVLFLNNDIGDKFHGIQPKIIVLLSAAAFMFLVGLIDDIKGLRARVKFLCQLAAAITVCAFGIRITSIAVSDWFTLNLGWFSWPLTLFWIVGVTNAVNLIDGLDGLAAGISAIACGVMVVLALYFGQPVMAVIMLSLCGALTGFLFFNFNPAKVFMGDCGSLFLGFTLASASVMCATKSHAIVGLTLPIIALGIPILDTLFSMLRRFLERRSIFSPDRSHFHHRLLALGLHQR